MRRQFNFQINDGPVTAFLEAEENTPFNLLTITNFEEVGEKHAHIRFTDRDGNTFKISSKQVKE